MEIRRATREDIPALTHLRPSVHAIHVAAHPDNFKPVTLAAATRDVEGLLDKDAEVSMSRLTYKLTIREARHETAALGLGQPFEGIEPSAESLEP